MSNKRFPFHFLFFILLCSYGCGVQQDKGFSKEEVIEEIEKMLNDYHHDIQQGGLTAEFNYLDQSNDFFWVPPGYQSALTYDSVRTILESSAPQFKEIQFHWEVLDIYPLSRNVATYSGIVAGTILDTSNIPSSVSIIESGTLIRRKDGWKLLSGQSAVLSETQ